MSLILIEGLDRTGKSTVAKYFESQGYIYIHQSAPKNTTKDEYLQEQIDLISMCASKDVVLDRSYYGEACIWPNIYNRKALLNEEDLDMLREIEESVGVKRIWMTDDNISEHWQRCLDNNEPLDKAQFAKARGLYSSMAVKYGFEKITLPLFLKQFPDAAPQEQEESNETDQVPEQVKNENINQETSLKKQNNKTPEQIKLEKANTINEILSKRILKGKGQIYDNLEQDIRNYLNSKLSNLLGGNNSNLEFSPEEVAFYKAMYKKAISSK
jgi:hypothetical protein